VAGHFQSSYGGATVKQVGPCAFEPCTEFLQSLYGHMFGGVMFAACCLLALSCTVIQQSCTAAHASQ
jgi:hypothetical protein